MPTRGAKFLILTLILLGAGTLVALFFFSKSLFESFPLETDFTFPWQQDTTSTNPSSGSYGFPTPAGFNPANFRGPSGAPHIIGPKSDPPNY